jgi:hypothetical protein
VLSCAGSCVALLRKGRCQVPSWRCNITLDLEGLWLLVSINLVFLRPQKEGRACYCLYLETLVLWGCRGKVKRDEVTAEWRKLHIDELSVLYCSPNTVWVIKSRRMIWAGHVVRVGERRGVYRVLLGKPEGKRPRCRWEDNIKMDPQEVGCGLYKSDSG